MLSFGWVRWTTKDFVSRFAFFRLNHQLLAPLPLPPLPSKPNVSAQTTHAMVRPVPGPWRERGHHHCTARFPSASHWRDQRPLPSPSHFERQVPSPFFRFDHCKPHNAQTHSPPCFFAFLFVLFLSLRVFLSCPRDSPAPLPPLFLLESCQPSLYLSLSHTHIETDASVRNARNQRKDNSTPLPPNTTHTHTQLQAPSPESLEWASSCAAIRVWAFGSSTPAAEMK